MTLGFHLRCIRTGDVYAHDVYMLTSPSGSELEVAYDAAPAGEAPRLPLAAPDKRLTLGEGRTPMFRLLRVGNELGLRNLWAKLEMMAPTGSFKDRGSSVLVSVALESGVTEFVEDSSGNAGASLAAYAAAAGLSAHVFVPASASAGKLDQIRVYGAGLHPVEGPRQAATDAAREFAEAHGLPYLSHNYSPYFIEGMKAFAYEVVDSAAGDPPHVVFPVGNGSLLIGAYKGFQELSEAGLANRMPRLHAIQAGAISPVVAELEGRRWETAEGGKTIASGISVSAPPRIGQIVGAVRVTGGAGAAVADESIARWQRKLAESEGVFCEATSAAAFAGLEDLVRRGVIGQGEDVVVPVTGSGLKEPLPEQG